MEGRDIYWLRRQVSRRTTIRGAAMAGLGASAFALLGCGDDAKPQQTATAASAAPTATAAPTVPPSATATAAPSPTPAPLPPELQVPDPKIVVRGQLIAPKDADPQIDDALEPHYVVPPAGKARGELFMFLPGASSLPEYYRLIADQGARNGFHAIVLNIPTVVAQGVCAGDISCFEPTRQQVLDGQSRPGSKAPVSRPNSIENRLLKLLAFLHARSPGEGWEAYIDSLNPKWELVVSAGHAEGATDAALIAKEKVVARVAMMAGPLDHMPGGRVAGSVPAPWLLGPHATPSERYFSFGHSEDEYIDWAVQWSGLKLGLNELGGVANVDTIGPPYGESHLLMTSASPAPGGGGAPNEASVAFDFLTPKDASGQPRHAPVWQYMCFA